MKVHQEFLNRLTCGHTVILLEAIGFQWDTQIPQSTLRKSNNADRAELGVQEEEYLGWKIQYGLGFCVFHASTGHLWIPQFEETEDVKRVKVLIRKGFEQDLTHAMGVDNA